MAPPPQTVHEPVFEDEDDWLNGYLATTKYSNDDRIMSKPVKQVKPAKPVKPVKPVKELQKKKYSLQTTRSRRASCGNFLTPGNVANLPERVNSVRDRDGSNGGISAGGGHFVRDYKGLERPPMAGRRVSVSRRDSIDYDALESVQLRLMQMTSAYVLKQDVKSGNSNPLLYGVASK